MSKKKRYLFELNTFFVRPCPYMVGMAEAWYINKIVLVSPAVFQLLTDKEDMETLLTVIKNLKLKEIKFQKLKNLVMKRWYDVPLENYRNITARIRINPCDIAEVLDPPTIARQN